MIDSLSVFPNNVIEALVSHVEAIDPKVRCLRRRLVVSDASYSVGITVSSVVPDAETFEMVGMSSGHHDATIRRYEFSVQALVKDAKETRGMYSHALLSQLVWVTLARNPNLDVVLGELRSTILGTTETTSRWGISRQQFFSNELQGSFVYLTVLDFWLETQTF